ncbi:unnamed protein product [Oppiella nova]|uniref:non-specific serine/threonine protein kinase n=1 Tax=Oppiella nova TaxID=334625 RepID=A0A7R9QIW6_9ACAR|nr:unnamed protein product [Oppiella nova]CAG2165886.1 unnamed protein product [Oppiella nova]
MVVWSLPSLQELYLQDNCLECIPKYLCDLSNNKIHSLPYAFWTAPKLREINLSLNLLRDLPVRLNTTPISLSPKHQKSDILTENLIINEKDSETDDKNCDSETKWTANLINKDVNRVNIWNQNVEVVAVAHNDEESDPRHNCKLVSLNLSHNGFQRIPPTLSCLAINLTRLNMSYNCLQSLGCVKSYPVNIKHIDLSHNQISEWFRVDFDDKSTHSECSSCYSDLNPIPSPVTKTSITSVKSLKCNSCCIHKQHNRLDNLRTLILSNNKLTQIVINCEDKDVNCDEFERLDENNPIIKGLRYNKLLFANLSMLDVSNNLIAELCPNISDLSNLSVLNISDNKHICYLPPEMGLLNKLWNLSTRGCNLSEPLKTMIESKKYKTMDIIGYLKSILENAKPYARMKLMIVGIQGIGKTSLLELLRQEGGGSYRKRPPEHWGKRMGNKNLNMKTPRGVTLSTVGVDVCDWTFEKKVRGQPSFGAVSFRTWDFGGQREYYATHQYFLSKRSLYLVVWKIIDGERGVEGLFQWLVNIQARAPNSPVIIVGTHYDLIKEYFPPFYAEELQQNIRQRFMNVVDPDKCGLPRVIDSIEISIKTKHNIKLLCNLIYDTVFELRCPGSKERLLEQRVPATYLALEDVVSYLALERKQEGKDPVLRSEQYKTAVIGEMMNRYGMTFRDMSELHSATIFLHENGVLLHYEDSTLKDIYFLDPQWLFDMLAHVVTIREINPYARNGLMKIEDLKQLFKLSRCAPTDAQTYLLNLLNKFEVAVTWDSRTLLIPSLLHSEEDLRAGLPGCDVRIPVRSRGWALRKSVPNKDLSVNELKINFQIQSLFEAPKTPPIVSLDERRVSIPETSQSVTKRQTQCSVHVISRPKHSVHRLLLMTYFPSGFIVRFISRILGDDTIIDIIRSYFKIPANAQSDPILLSLFNTKAEWMCWQTGMALKHFHTYLIRVKEVFSHLPLSPYDYYNMKLLVQMDGQWNDIQLNKSSLLEIYLPNHCLAVETINSEGISRNYTLEPNQEMVAKLLVIVVEHMDTLLEDWYPTLGTRFVHTSEGKFLVTRLVPCSPCLINQMSSSHSNTTHSSPTLTSSGTPNQLRSPDDVEWQLLDFGNDGSQRNIGSSDSRDSGMGRESRDSSRISSVEGAHKSSSLSNQSCDKNISEEPVVYSFLVEECILAVYEQKAVICPIHSRLNMQTIAPDTVFYDLGDHYLIKPDKLKYGKLLGRGAFGFVFKATIKDSTNYNAIDVAMKMLQPVDPGYGARKSDTVAFKAANNRWERDPMQYACKAYCTARQELNILLNLKHQNIVPLVGLCTKPLSLILQLAPMGSLDHIIKNYRRSGVQFNALILQKIMLQISKALEYLHRQRIIYRDLKSENVLVWDMPQPFETFHPFDSPKVDIKLADYGISRPSLPTGTKGFGGTEGFMAPEIMRYNGEEEYTEKVDCFSFAMFLYELFTLRLPFENQECVKEHILEGGRPSLSQRDLSYPSYFIDIMTLCWAQQPRDRPSISQIVSIISAPEFIHLLDVISLNENYAVLSANGVNTCSQSSRVILSRIGKQTDLITCNDFCWTDYQTIASLNNVTVMSICLVEDELWFGDSKASIHIYCVNTFERISCVELELEDNTPTAIRCMCYVSCIRQVAISSSSGRLWMCSTGDHSFKEIGNNGIAFLCVVNVDISAHNNDCELWCGQSEGNIAVITLSESHIKSQHIVSHYDDDNSDGRTPINERFDVFQIEALYPYVWTYLYPGCVVWQWDVRKRSMLCRLDCSKLAPCSESLMSISIEEHLTPGSCQVTALTVLEERCELYVGTTWGCIIIVEGKTMRPITVFRPYEEEVKAIIKFKPLKSSQCKTSSNEFLDDKTRDKEMIATIGKGYRCLLNRFLSLDKNKSITQRDIKVFEQNQVFDAFTLRFDVIEAFTLGFRSLSFISFGFVL